LQITRASHVEPDSEGYWWADMGPVGGPALGPFRSRPKAMEPDREWLASRSTRLPPWSFSSTDAVTPRGLTRPSP
jgi:hypothetical protein